MEGERGTVCVTGGTGYLASCLIMKLLEQGYSVNTTVRPHPGKFSIYFLGWGGGGFGDGEMRDLSLVHGDI
jgi:nucleoside-diphosphate-sugar epimerase